MKILMTNDDGIDAPGLQALIEPLSALGELYVFAPNEQQSGKSHGMSNTDICVQRRSMKGVKEACAVYGTPGDCVRMALCEFQVEPDIVISGINFGHNLGWAALYSGTIGAAREAFLRGIPAIALSLDCHKGSSCDFTYTAGLAPRLIRLYLESGLQKQCFWNVNVPDGPVKGFRWTRYSVRSILTPCYNVEMEDDMYHFTRSDPRVTYTYAGGENSIRYDHYACRSGYVSICPVNVPEAPDLSPLPDLNSL